MGITNSVQLFELLINRAENHRLHAFDHSIASHTLAQNIYKFSTDWTYLLPKT